MRFRDGDGGFGTWQARIPEESGETVTTRYTLRELLDRLDELTADGSPARPRADGCPRGALPPEASRADGRASGRRGQR